MSCRIPLTPLRILVTFYRRIVTDTQRPTLTIPTVHVRSVGGVVNVAFRIRQAMVVVFNHLESPAGVPFPIRKPFIDMNTSSTANTYQPVEHVASEAPMRSASLRLLHVPCCIRIILSIKAVVENAQQLPHRP